MAWLRGLGGAVARAIRGRIGQLLGKAASATGVAIAFGAGSELAGIAITEYQLQSLINDLPRAMDEMMGSIDKNKVFLDRVRSAFVRTRIESALARFTARAAELRGFRFAGNWLAGLLIFQQFSILVTEVYKALWDLMIARFQRFALVDLSDQQYVRTGDMNVENVIQEWQTRSPEELAKINLKEFIDIQNDFNALATFFDAIGRTSALGQWLGFSALARAVTNVTWALGIGWLSWVAMGPGMRATIANPLERFYNKTLRQTDLPRETALRLWRKRLIDDSELADRLAILGHPDRDIELLKRDESEFFTEAQIADMLETGMVTVDEAKGLLERIGWREPELGQRLKLVTHVAKARLRDRWVSRLEQAFSDGFVSLQEIQSARSLNLDTVGLDDLRNFIVRHELEMSLASLKVKTLQERFLDGTIDEDTLRSQLAGIVVVPEVLEAMVENLKARKQPRERVEREETLERRKRTLENRLETLTLQIRHQQRLRDDALALIDARRARVIAERDAEVSRVRELADARIAAMEAEFQAFAGRTAAEIEARIRELRAITDARVREVMAELEARKAAIDEELETFRAATSIEIEERINMLRRIAATQTGVTQQRTFIRIDYLETVKDLPVLRREAEAETRKRRLEDLANAEAERLKASAQAAEELLREIAGVRVEARAAVLDALKDRVRAEADARVGEIVARADARLGELDAEANRIRSTYETRIERLTLQADQVREELELVNQALARRAA
jgi:chaperonin cofactor prefoldin